jgi:hypothetical protein
MHIPQTPDETTLREPSRIGVVGISTDQSVRRSLGGAYAFHPYALRVWPGHANTVQAIRIQSLWLTDTSACRCIDCST